MLSATQDTHPGRERGEDHTPSDENYDSRSGRVGSLGKFVCDLRYLLVSASTKIYFRDTSTAEKKKSGDAGFRTQDLLHAKQTLYH